MAVAIFRLFNLLHKSAIDLYASNIGKIMKFINTTRSTEFSCDIINIFYYFYLKHSIF